jgi:HipA-like protein
MGNLKIIGVRIFLEKRTTNMLVGVLEKIDNRFVFTYDEGYFRYKHSFSIGPEFPMTEKTFSSENLFPSFTDRIPSRHNPAYPDYCDSMGIGVDEKDPFILLSTIGRRGPSSFVYYPFYERGVSDVDLIEFRKSLGLTTREFASVFELSQSSVNAIERKRGTRREVLKQLEILIHFPDVALQYVIYNGGYLFHDKLVNCKKVLRAKISALKDSQESM